jgi:hypothetical protein
LLFYESLLIGFFFLKFTAGIRGLNALIHHIPSMKYTQFGESTYLPSTRKSLGGGVELWMGWFESVRPGQGIKKYFILYYYKLFICLLDLIFTR